MSETVSVHATAPGPARSEIDLAAVSDADLIQSHILAAREGDSKAYTDLMLAVAGEKLSRHPQHYLIHDFLDACLAAKKHAVIITAPEQGKSSRVRGWLAHKAGSRRGTRVGLVSADEDLAKKSLKIIRNSLVSDVSRYVFPDLVPDKKRSFTKNEWSSERLYFQGDQWPSFEVYPFDGATEGARLDICWLDDTVTRRCQHSEAERLRAHSAIHGTWLNRITEGGIVVVTNNVWHREDPVQKMLDSPSFACLQIGYEGCERMFWRLTHPPVTWNRETEGHFPLWSAWPQARLQSKRDEDHPTYTRLYRLQPKVAEEMKFPPVESWARYSQLPEPGGRIYASLDPNGGKIGKRDDYAALWLVLARWDRVLLLIDGYVGRCTVDELIAKAFAMHRKWKHYGGIHRLRYEVLPKDEGYVLKAWQLEKERLRLADDPSWMLDTVPSHPQESKESRIERLRPWLANGWLLFPENMAERKSDGSELGTALRRLVEQIEDFPFGDHDDAPDALSLVVDNAQSGGVDKPLTPEAAAAAEMARRQAEYEAIPTVEEFQAKELAGNLRGGNSESGWGF